jgi:P-type Ca2+ transporter type 2B
MCTGDNIKTAKAIARNAGILESDKEAEKNYACMEGAEFEEEVGGLIEDKLGSE